MKTFYLFPFCISVGTIDCGGFTPIMWQIYKGRESGKWTMDFCLCDFYLAISFLK
jgi:hypothetical protein